MSICNPPFRLADINIIGGDYQEILFHIYDEDNGVMMDIENLELNFALIDYKNRYGTPIISRPCSAAPNDDTAFLVVLEPDDTKDLADKYIYQVTVKAPNDKQKSFQGLVTIDKNIDPDAFAEEDNAGNSDSSTDDSTSGNAGGDDTSGGNTE